MADSLRDSSAGPFSGQQYLTPFKLVNQNLPFKLDEGYSEETRSLNGSEMLAPARPDSRMDDREDEDNMGMSVLSLLHPNFMDLPESTRAGTP